MTGRFMLSCVLLTVGIQTWGANPACDKDSPSFDPEKCAVNDEKSQRKCDPKIDKDCPVLNEKKTPLRGTTTPLKTGALPSGAGSSAPDGVNDGTSGETNSEETAPAEEPAGMSAQSAERGRDTSARAMSKASAAGSAMMRNMVPTDDGMAGPKSGGAASKVAGGAAGTPGAPAQPANIANPATSQDLALAAVAGYGETFSQLGLKVGAGRDGASSILRQDGTPASAAEISILAERIGAEPEALMHRPDFFKVLPRENFADLKEEYKKPERKEAEFKHIELSAAQRDFKRSESCDKLSGRCNRYARQTSYRRGDYVPPEDLGDLWKKIKSEASGADDPYGAAPSAAVPAGDVSRLGVERAASITQRMKSMLGGFLGGFFGSDSVPEGRPMTGAERDAQSRVDGAALPWSASAKKTVAFTEQPSRTVAGEVPLEPERAAPGRIPARRGGFGWAVSAAAALALLLFFWTRRRDEKRVVGTSEL